MASLLCTRSARCGRLSPVLFRPSALSSRLARRTNTTDSSPSSIKVALLSPETSILKKLDARKRDFIHRAKKGCIYVVSAFREAGRVQVLTPAAEPSPDSLEGWVYGDNAEGIRSALDAGATHLWVTKSGRNDQLQDEALIPKHIRAVAQPPQFWDPVVHDAIFKRSFQAVSAEFRPKRVVLKRDSEQERTEQALDKLLREAGVEMPVRLKFLPLLTSSGHHFLSTIASLSHRLNLKYSPVGEAAQASLEAFPQVTIREALTGPNLRFLVLPARASNASSSGNGPARWEVLAPLIGSRRGGARPVTDEDMDRDPHIKVAKQQAEDLAPLMGLKAPFRVDFVRRDSDETSLKPWMLEGVNPSLSYGCSSRDAKPKQTLNEVQLMANGIPYVDFLHHVLESACTVEELRKPLL